MGLFGKSFSDQVNDSLEKVRAKFPSASVSASVEGKRVTLRGQAPDMETKAKVMAEFNSLVETENTVNQITIPQQQRPAAAKVAQSAPQPTPAPAAAPPVATPGVTHAAERSSSRVHEVVKGDTLSALAKRYYGKASAYPKIFEANRDILDDPDKIKVGQKLRIPE